MAPQDAAAAQESAVYQDKVRSPEPPPASASREAPPPETQVVLRKPDAKVPELPKTPTRSKLPAPTDQVTRLAPGPVAPKPAVKAEASVPESKIGTHRHWAVMTGTAEGQKTCSLMTLPLGSTADLASADAPHVRVRYAVSRGYFKAPRIMLGESAKPDSEILVVIDGKEHRFKLAEETSALTVRDRSWQLIREMLAGIRMAVRFTATDGALRSHDYSLLGFTRAYRRTNKECRGAASKVVRRAVLTPPTD
ncbi:MAG: hypothetical protein OEO83_06060 [Alphaproteobacteria bacterium]|nr:hypothetical protein [Alphaproteobacteria bacterium]